MTLLRLQAGIAIRLVGLRGDIAVAAMPEQRVDRIDAAESALLAALATEGAALCARIYEHAQSRGVAVECFQSNHEGAIIDAIQEADTAFDGIVINPGAYTHYSYAIHDALKAVSIPAVEVHMSDIQKREEFRHLSVTAPACIAQIRGHGFESYTMAIDMLAKLNPEEK